MITVLIPTRSKEVVLDAKRMDGKMVDLLRKRIELYERIKSIDSELLKFSKNGRKV